MFGVDRSHVAQGRGDPAGKAKPYSGPTDPVGWLATAARHALSHHHPESFAPHVVFPPYLLVKVCGPKRAVAVATGAAAGRAAFAAAAARGLALSLCYVMHADWFNDVCDVDVDAKNKPERPLPSGACSRAQGLLVAALQDASTSVHALRLNEAHGTGTALGDPTEAGAIAAVHGSTERDVPLVVGAAEAGVELGEVRGLSPLYDVGTGGQYFPGQEALVGLKTTMGATVDRPVTTYSRPGCTRVPKYIVSGLSRPILVKGPVPLCRNGWSRS